MMIKIFDDYYSPQILRSNPNCLFIFGDNAERYGKGGQAVIRDEPNAVGIATKLSPRAYMNDSDLTANVSLILKDLQIIDSSLRQGKVIYWPRDGIGTGLSDMPNKCPRTFAILVAIMDNMFETYGDTEKISTWGR